MDFNSIIVDNLSYIVFFKRIQTKSIFFTLDMNNNIRGISKSLFEYTLNITTYTVNTLTDDDETCDDKIAQLNSSMEDNRDSIEKLKSFITGSKI